MGLGKWIAGTVLALAGGFAGAGLFAASGLGDGAIQRYLLAHPEMLREMAGALQARDQAARLKPIEDAVTTGFPGAVLGNPQGTRVLVKFTDYGCTYCRASVADVDRLIAADPELKVVVREWPIFEGSEAAARMGLAAAKQGRFAAFYHAMFEQGPPSAANVERAAIIAGLDMAAARAFAGSQEASEQIALTASYARQLGFDGTPSWVAGGRTFQGQVGEAALAEALKAG